MPRRRPVLTNPGAVACLVLWVSACAPGPVEVAAPEQSEPTTRACEELVDALPDEVDGVERREVEPDTGTTAGWGDPAIVLHCGVPEPPGFNELSACQITNGVAWWIPDEQITGQAVDIVMTTIGRSPGVEVSIPAEHFPPAETMVDLAGAVRQHSTQVKRCG
jgi:Protein of unknown function (DUF3515)